MKNTRIQTKLEMNRLRLAHYSPALGNKLICRCDHCMVNLASDMHECVERSRVMFAPDEIHDLIYQPELCGLLCRSCHQNAGLPEVIESIEAVNLKIFGAEAICIALGRIPEVYRTQLLYGDFCGKEEN